MTKLIVLARFSLPHQAHLARATLEVANISAFVVDEHTVSANPFYSDAIGGVKLKVAEEDAQKASEILATDFSEELVEAFGEITHGCPSCGGTNYSQAYQGILSSLLSLLIFAPVQIRRDKMRCHDCKNIWQI